MCRHKKFQQIHLYKFYSHSLIMTNKTLFIFLENYSFWFLWKSVPGWNRVGFKTYSYHSSITHLSLILFHFFLSISSLFWWAWVNLDSRTTDHFHYFPKVWKRKNIKFFFINWQFFVWLRVCLNDVTNESKSCKF